jgi:hypothetical protein
MRAYAFLCIAVGAGCGQSASGPGFDPSFGNQDDDSGVVPGPDSGAGASSGDASAGADSKPPGSRDADASAPGAGNPHGLADAGDASRVSTPDAGTDASRPLSDGGPCTVNLGCVLAAAASTGDIRQDCVNRVNQFRTACACLKPLARWTAGEACADMDAQYDAMKQVAHGGAMANICNWGSAQDECPGDPSNQSVIGQCLQAMWSEGPPPAGTTVAQCESPQMLATCYEAHGHFINMSNPAATGVACGFYTTSTGAVWAVQNFSP